MSTTNVPRASTYRIARPDGRRYVVYNAAAIGNPFDHVADKWYFLRAPASLGFSPGEPFDTAEAAEIAAQATGTSQGRGHSSVGQELHAKVWPG